MAEYEYIDDFGEKIGGARKDMWSERAMSTNDVSKMTVKELEKFVSKELVWSEPDLDALLDDGRAVEIVLYIYEIYNSIKKKPGLQLANKTEKEIRDDAYNYIHTVEIVRDAALGMMELEDRNMVYTAMVENHYFVGFSISHKCQDCGVFTKRFVKLVYNVVKDKDYLKRYCEIQQFPNSYTKELRDIDIKQRLYSANKAYYIYDDDKIIYDIEPFNTYAEALEYVHKDYLDELSCVNDVKKKSKDKKVKMKIVRPQLDRIVRTGPDVRAGRDVTGDDMQGEFKIRAGEFGKWNNQEDRQACLNYSYDAMCDLAFALGISRDALSLGKDVYEGNKK